MNPFSGLAGDMLVGALLDVGADVPAFWQGLQSLAIPEEWSASARTVLKTGIAAKQFHVQIANQTCHHAHEHEHAHKHEHAHEHEHTHEHEHEHAHEHEHTHEHVHGRHLAEIEGIIADSAIPAAAKELAIATFRRLADAEAKVHGTTPDKIHFHEVGAVDAIVDVCGACLAYVLLKIDATVCTPIALGGGTVHCAHGTMPVPVPAVCNLLEGIPTSTGPVNKELTTPTGAALIATLCSDFSGQISGMAETTGYGAGTREFPNHANVLPVTIYTTPFPSPEPACVTVLTCSVDDATGEDLGALIEILMTSEALDATATPCIMKKGRPGYVVEVLCKPIDVEQLSKTLMRHSSTFGIRRHTVERTILNRFFTEVDTRFGTMRVKIGVFSGRDEVIQAAPEFEDCLQAARKAGVSPATVRRAALAAWETTQHKET